LVWFWVLKISPKNPNFLPFFPSDQKKSLWVGSKSTHVKNGLASFFTAGQEYEQEQIMLPQYLQGLALQPQMAIYQLCW